MFVFARQVEIFFSKHFRDTGVFHFQKYDLRVVFLLNIREGVNGKKRFLSGIARMMGKGGSTHARIFGPLFRSAFLVNKKSPFLQKCQCIELLTVF